MASASHKTETIDVPVMKMEKKVIKNGVILELTYEEAVYLYTIVGRCNQYIAQNIYNALSNVGMYESCDNLIIGNINCGLDINPREKQLLAEHVAKWKLRGE